MKDDGGGETILSKLFNDDLNKEECESVLQILEKINPLISYIVDNYVRDNDMSYVNPSGFYYPGQSNLSLDEK